MKKKTKIEKKERTPEKAAPLMDGHAEGRWIFTIP